jgi:glycerophosphoryl diester phosphodiesterase
VKGDMHSTATADVLRAARGEAPGNAVVSSFDPPALVAMAEHLPGWVRWLNIEDEADANLDRAVALGCGGVSVEWRLITPAYARRARDAGLTVAAWTVRRRATFDRLGRLGVIGVCVEAAALDGP